MVLVNENVAFTELVVVVNDDVAFTELVVVVVRLKSCAGSKAEVLTKRT